MNVNIVQFLIAAVFIVLGVVVMALETFGIFRIRYVLNRMHAAAMGDSLGIFLIVVGVMVMFGFSMASVKLITLVVLFWFASPVCSHLLARLEASTNEHLEEDCEVPDHDIF